ncbi:MAG: EamA family transporter [Planctomycetota bacterium]|nr:EamA family transporter [Planctomycetota bacterium]MDA1142308.1 EamA family transporter [Planctomycetota bacterium]
MIFLLIHIFFSTAFGLVIKEGQRRKVRLMPLGMVNYVVAGSWFTFLCASQGWPEMTAEVAGTGIFGGVAYIISYFFLVACMGFQGISIPSTLLRLSQLVPVLYAMLCWGETPNPFQGLGLTVFCVAILLLMPGDPRKMRQQKNTREFALMAGLFLVTGFCGVATKRFSAIAPTEMRGVFLMFLFGTTAVIGLGILLVRREMPNRTELVLGALLGICNLVGNNYIVLALEALGGIVVFPVGSAVAILITACLAVLIWKETISRKAWIGIGLASLSVMLINLK